MQMKPKEMYNIDYYICYWNGSASLSVSDADPYVIIRNLLDSNFIILPNIHTRVGNSNVLTDKFCFVRLPAQGMTYFG
jgi:hypothetical protein